MCACGSLMCPYCNPTPPEFMARSDDPDTSKAAAGSLSVAALEAAVLAVIRDAGETGVTVDDLLDALPGFSYQSVSPRPAALKRKGLVRDSGVRRRGRSGRGQVVLVAVVFEQ